MLLSEVNGILNRFRTINQAKQIHAQLIVNSLSDFVNDLAQQLIASTHSYTPTSVRYVQNLLHQQFHDCCLWSSAIRSFAQHGQFKEAFALYAQMQGVGVQPSTFSITSSLRSCARIPYKVGGISIHAQVHKYEILCSVYVQTALLDFYAKLGEMEAAKRIFDEMGVRNVVSWNSLLAGYLKCKDLAVAEELFSEMPFKDFASWNSMITGYARSGNMDRAHSLFQQMPVKNLASWNAIISGYVECGKVGMARHFFYAMPQRNNISWVTMISGYSKCGDVYSAENLFHLMPEKDVFAFNSMIACYAQNSRPKEAIHLFNRMLTAKLNAQPDNRTLTCVICACSELGNLHMGSWIESYIRKSKIELDDYVATALVDLYAKCGNIDKAYEWFHRLNKRDIVAYTAMISGCGINGKPRDAIKLFEEMLSADVSPNLVTFTGILTACNHAGLVEQGYMCFELMRKFGLMPSADHYAIMVDLFGRAGRLDEAYDLIKSMPTPPHSGVWGALLRACQLHNNVDLGEVAAQHCFSLETDNAGYSTLLSNIYATNAKWDDVNKLRSEGSAKIPGFSWV